MNQRPSISVVVRTKDRPVLLAEALASVAASAHAPAEVVLVNDGGTPPVLPPRFPVPIVRVELAENQGRAAAAQAGVTAATGDALTFLDDDDLVGPDHLSTLAELLAAPGVSVAYTDAAVGIYERRAGEWTRRERLVPYSRDFDPDVLALDNYIPFNTLAIERRLFDEVGPFDITLPFFEDWDYLIRLSQRTHFRHLARVTCEYRHMRGAGDQVFGEHPGRRSDFLAVKAQVLEKHAATRSVLSLARAIDTLRAEAAGADAGRRQPGVAYRALRRGAGVVLDAAAHRNRPVPDPAGRRSGAPRVALVCSEPIRPVMAGNGIRFAELARRLPAFGIDVVMPDPGRWPASLEGCDAVVVQGQLADDVLRRCPRLPAVVDLYDPWLIENMTYATTLGPDIFRRDLARWSLQLSRGDFFLCSSEEQRAFYLGGLAVLGRVNPTRLATDPDLSQLISAVPFGIPDELPAHRPWLPARRPGERRLLFGGLYDWYDPWTLLDALVVLDRPDWTLLFAANPNPATTPQSLLAQVEQRCRRLGWWDSRVQVVEWAPADRRWDLLRDVDLVVAPHGTGLEPALSMRTRFLDALAAGRPVVASAGGAMSRLLVEHGAGWVTPPHDVAGLAACLVEAMDHPGARAAGAGRLLAEFRWDRVLAPLVDFCRQPRQDPTKGPPPWVQDRLAAVLRARVDR